MIHMVLVVIQKPPSIEASKNDLTMKTPFMMWSKLLEDQFYWQPSLISISDIVEIK